MNDMLPYLRLAHVNDPLDLPSVSFAQGPICTVGGTHTQAHTHTHTRTHACTHTHLSNKKSTV